MPSIRGGACLALTIGVISAPSPLLSLTVTEPASNIGRDARLVSQFAGQYAHTEGLSPAQTEQLSRRTVSQLEWVKVFRRALEVARKYPADHPHREAAHQRLSQVTTTHLGMHNVLELHFRQDHTCTLEGFPFPPATGDVDTYTFFPLYRDSIEMLRLRPGTGRRELDEIVAVIVAGGRRAGDDAFTWLWRQRFASVDIRVEPKLNAQLAVALAVRGSATVSADAFLTAFQTAGPFFLGGDNRQAFTTETFESLVPQGLDPARAREMLHSPQPAALLPPVTQQDVTNLRKLYSHEQDRTVRISSLRERHFGAG